MALRRRPKRAWRKPIPPPPPELHEGDRVRLKTSGARGTVLRVRGRSVLLEMDEPFSVAGLTQRRYYSYPGELEPIKVAGRMGAQVLYAEEDGDLLEDEE
ncbi:MAG: hypothetical protein ACTHNU_02835 [Gaiellales bacterium]